LPLAFAAHAGSLLTLSGSPVNVIASEFADDAGAGSFGYFSFALVGLPLVVGTVAIVVLFGERLLPHRPAPSGSRDFSDHARTLVEQYGLGDRTELLTRSSGVAELIVPPRSELVGDTAFPGMVTESGELVVLAVQRKGEDLPGETVLAVGDTLLVQGTWTALEHRSTIPRYWSSTSPSWTTVILVTGMFPLSTAMTQTGAAGKLADVLVDVVGDADHRVLLLGLFVLTAVFGQSISNTATALIVIPRRPRRS